MEILLKNGKENIQAECVLRFGKGLEPGEASLASDQFGAVVLIGVDKTDDEEFENFLLHGFTKALQIVQTKGYKSISVKVDSFSTGEDHVSYIRSAIIDCLIEWRRLAENTEITVYLLSEYRQMNGALAQKVETALFVPVIETETQSFGDANDHLKEKFDVFLKENPKQISFQEYLFELIDSKNIRKYSEVYRKAGISKSVFSKITNFSKDHIYRPSKATVAALAIGLELDLDAAQKLYHSAGFHLGNSDLTDRVIRFFITERIYDVNVVNYCLEYNHLPLLGYSKDNGIRFD